MSELKAHLSKYLRLASRGVRIVVRDRDEPIAELGPSGKGVLTWLDRLEQAGRLRRGTQKWSALRISKTARPVDVQESLGEVREERREVRRY